MKKNVALDYPFYVTLSLFGTGLVTRPGKKINYSFDGSRTIYDATGIACSVRSRVCEQLGSKSVDQGQRVVSSIAAVLRN